MRRRPVVIGTMTVSVGPAVLPCCRVSNVNGTIGIRPAARYCIDKFKEMGPSFISVDTIEATRVPGSTMANQEPPLTSSD